MIQFDDDDLEEFYSFSDSEEDTFDLYPHANEPEFSLSYTHEMLRFEKMIGLFSGRDISISPEIGFRRKTVRELKSLLRNHHLPTTGVKFELIQRLIDNGISHLEEEKNTKETKPVPVVKYTEDELKDKKVVELKEILKQLRKPVSGKKSILIDRILNKNTTTAKKRKREKAPKVKETHELRPGDTYDVYEILEMRRDNKIEKKTDNCCFICLKTFEKDEDITERSGVKYCEECYVTEMSHSSAFSNYQLAQVDLRKLPCTRDVVGRRTYTLENVLKAAKERHGSLDNLLHQKLKAKEDSIDSLKNTSYQNKRRHYYFI
eukprot:TRINITY_DN1944_c0_g1_i3.p1 TRINITY_DN1944_c0_g1~~TRINITY_DN1944_c0_g1_i3.p1  ORF type:complete len:319 (+),score=72.63 TRINITY_DN1944_c0_g1_i3:194-1150(+)